MKTTGPIVVGISGWNYAPWRGPFYPKGLPARRELEYASRHVTGIEVNGTFYRLQKPENFRSWTTQTPPGFCLGVKAHRYITHRLRLKPEAAQPMRNFFASGLLALGEHLGPILWQLPPVMRLKDDRVETFVKGLPKTLGEMARLAREHDGFVEGRALTECPEELLNRPVRHAMEFRHPSFHSTDFLAMLREHGVAAVLGDSGEEGWPCIFDVTADFLYLRMHGIQETYVSGYTDAALDTWAGRIRSYGEGSVPGGVELKLPPPERKPRGVFCFFDNDAKAFAPLNAMAIMERLGLSPLESFETK